MGRIKEEDIQRVKDNVDIVEVISRFLTLKKAGSQYQAICPFHQEDTASFNVNPNRQIFKCFGCGKSGTVFNFMMDYAKMDFPTAVRTLAEEVGIVLEEDPYQRERRKKILHSYDTLDFAANFFNSHLHNPEGTLSGRYAHDYLSERGFTRDIIDQWKIGLAFDEWAQLTDLLLNRTRTSLEELVEAGITIERKAREGGYDRFRNRIMFPIISENNKILGFAGRKFQEDEDPERKEPKYINSPESPHFNKGKTLFGLNFAYKDVNKIGYFIIVEGYTDVIFAHVNGFTTTVAPMGTAFTEAHALKIKRYTNEVIFVFDADRGGKQAALRSIGIAQRLDLDARLVLLPEGSDPDTYLRENGAAMFAEKIENAISAYEYKFQIVFEDLEIERGKKFREEEKKKILKEMIPYIADTLSPTQASLQLEELSKVLDIRFETAATALDEFKTSKGKLVYDLSPFPTTPYEYLVIAKMTNAAHTIEYFRENLRAEWFHNITCGTVFMFLCDSTRKEEFDHSYQTPGEELPLLEKGFTDNVPREIIAYAKEHQLPVTEESIYRLYERIRHLDTETETRPGYDSLHYLLKEAHFEFSLIQLEEEILAADENGEGLKVGELYDQYTKMYHEYEDALSRQREKRQTGLEKEIRRRKDWFRRQQERLKRKPLPKKEEPREDPLLGGFFDS